MPDRLPDWPRKMKLVKACAYLDESRNTFLRRVDAGIYPKPIRIGGNTYWLRDQLDEALDKLAQDEEPLSQADIEPFLEALNGLPKSETRQ